EMISMSIVKRVSLGFAAAALVLVPLTACSSDSSSSTAASSSVDDSKPLAQINDLSKGKMTQVTLDSGFTGALTSLGLTPGTVGTATISADGVASFPITGGNVTYYKPGTKSPFVVGSIKHEGSGLSLTAGATKVELSNFTIDPGASKLYGDVTVNGTVAVQQAYLFILDGKTLKALQTSGTDAILEGTKVEVSADAAALLDKTFNTDAVKEGLLVGIAKITVATQ
ncbi:MAG: hypothetical protein JWM76_2381, partial [Pseudonocardiales bacterium]|nr:hypothetical protein [Pseudonocardiales bacterium]